MNHHLTLEEKIELLKNTTILDSTEVKDMAVILDCCPFAVLKKISEAIKTMSIGYDK